jgi:hypothetical protein
MESKSVSSYLTSNWINVITAVLMVLIIAQFYVVGGTVIATPAMDAFTRAIAWAGIITSVLMLRAMAVPIMRREKWWWHNFVFYGGFIFAVIAYPFYTDFFNQIYYVTTTAGVGAISSLSAFSFIVGTLATFTMRNRMNIWLTIWILVSIFPWTPFIDIFGAGFFNFSFWSFTTLMAGSAAAQTYVRDIAMLALCARAILTIEKFRPRIME